MNYDINTKERQAYIRNLIGKQSKEEIVKMYLFGAFALIILLAISN